MSFFTDASFVMDPNVYGVGKLYVPKPTDGTGDLTFTRASTGTRVNQDGLIEKVRTNELTYSNDFSNAAWGKSFAALTGGQSGYDGTNNAWKLQASGSTSCYINQGSFSVLRAHSIYAKAGTYDQISIINGGYGQGVQFDLTSGIIVTNSNSSIYSPTITSVGSGWYKISLGIQSFAPTYGFLLAPQLLNGGGIVDGEYIYIQNAQTEYNDIATDYIATTTSAVSVGPLANIPRLNYGSDGCPSLLLEPQRTNLIFPSEDFSNINFLATNLTVTTNQAISPDGNQNADKLTTTSTTGECQVRYSNFSVSSNVGSAFTTTVYAKKGTADFLRIRNLFVQDGGGFGSAWFNINNGTVSSVQSSQIARITDAGNGYYRCSLTGIVGTSPLNIIDIGITNTNGVNFPTTAVDGFIYGAMLEQGSYATSYIPTLSAEITRVQEGAFKAGISSLIGQTEGVAFVDFVWNGLTGTGSYPRVMELWADSSNYLQFYTVAGDATVYWEIKTAGVVQFDGNTSMSLGHNKIAIGYKLNDMVIYKNGALIASDATCAVPSTSAFGVAGSYVGSGAQLAASVNQALLFKTRLSNADLARLTSL